MNPEPPDLSQTVEIIGFLAGFFTTICMVPQVYKIWRTKHVEDLSRAMYALLCLGLSFWLTFGILIGSVSAILWNSIAVTLCLSILIMIFLYKK